MSIATTTARQSYSGNGSTTVFSIPFAFLDETYLKVILRDNTTGVETTQVLTTDYTVSGTGDEPSGSLTMLAAPATGKTLTIIGNPPLTQEMELSETGALPILSLERAFDKLTRIAVMLKDSIGRVVRVSDAFPSTFNTQLPDTMAADGLLGINADATGWEVKDPTELGIPIDTLSPVDITNPAVGDALIFDGTNWVNSQQSTTAANVAVTPSGNLTSSDAQAAFQEHQGDIDSINSDVSTLQSDVSAAQSDITTAQGDISTLQTDVAAKADASALTAHESDTTTHGTTGDIVGTSDAQTLSAKTFSDAVTLSEIATPATPAAGKFKVYPKSDKKLYTLDSDGTETEVGSGSGGGGALVVTGSRGTPEDITAAGGIAFTGSDARQMWFVQGDSGDVTVTANPQIAAGSTVGQELVLVGRNDSQAVALNDGTGLSLNGAISLIGDSVIALVWDGTNWVEMYRR